MTGTIHTLPDFLFPISYSSVLRPCPGIHSGRKEKGGLKRPPFFMGKKNAGNLCNIEKYPAIR